MRIRIVLTVLALLGVAACGDSNGGRHSDSAAAAAEATVLPPGEAMLPVPDGKIWYRKSGPGNGAPVILVHGGPGYSSYYLRSLEALGSDRPVIRYDQLGAGKSDRIADTTLFTIAHFVRELDSLRSALGYDKVHVVGHSWGSILVHEYYQAHPDRVASIVYGSAVLDVPAFARHARSLVATLSDSAQRAIEAAEAAKKYDTPAYQSAMTEFNEKYVWRRPVAAELDSMMKTLNEQIYVYMQGPSEFTITGTLKNYNVRSQLAGIKVPTLYTVGEFDEVGPNLVRRFAEATPGSRFELIPGSAHVTPWDNPQAMLQVVRAFLREADAKASSSATTR